MSAARRMLVLASMLACGACASETPPRAVAVDPQVAAHLDSTNASLSAIYRARDAKAYGTLFTDSAVFEWPAIPNVRGRAQLENMALENWQSLIGLELKVTPSSRVIGADHATEFGAFEESWHEANGTRKIEYGRYAEVFARQPNGFWLIDHFLGFEDSTVTRPRP